MSRTAKVFTVMVAVVAVIAATVEILRFATHAPYGSLGWLSLAIGFAAGAGGLYLTRPATDVWQSASTVAIILIGVAVAMPVLAILRTFGF